ncbi:MAG: hypothetical protein IT350_19325 [Deltaproteobacteria bacterium]|nr:hypothetical protein [Deltaproteobacteria bacterium]
MTSRPRFTPSFVTVWVAAMWIVLALVSSCANGNDDDDSEMPTDIAEGECWLTNPSDQEGLGYSKLFCSGDDPNDDSDDDTDDDTHWGTPPLISNGIWDPTTATDDATGKFLSDLTGSVCDIDNDLAGGQIFIWVTGQDAQLLAYEIFWADFGPEISDVANCDLPASFGVTVDFTEIVPYGDDVCVDLEVSDGEGNLSNKLTNICVYLP